MRAPRIGTREGGSGTTALRRLLGLTVASGIVVTAGLAGAAPAQAKPVEATGNVSTAAKTVSGQAINSKAAEEKVLKYWTPERMASAKNLDLKVDRAKVQPRTPQAKGIAGSVAPLKPVRAPKVGARAVNESQTVGKVYVTTPTGTGQCSASTVASGKRRLVVTAGHCVHGGQGSVWYRNLIFVPRYRGINEPYGRFVAYQLTARSAWVTSSNSDEDMAFAIMNNGGIWGAKVVDTVGGNGLRWNWGYSNPVTVLGYPSAGGFPGNVQYACQSTTWKAHLFSQQVRTWCNQTQGSSGGPWLQAYNGSTGLGYVNSVVSHRHSDARTMDGPYFDNDIKSLYDFSEALSPA